MGRYTFKKGRAGEDIACNYLVGKGFKLIERNFRTRWGEIDLVMAERNTLVLVEVKFGYRGKAGRPAERLTRAKRRNFVNAVKYYLMTKGIRQQPIRVDVVEIIQKQAESSQEEGLEIHHYPDAFGEE